MNKLLYWLTGYLPCRVISNDDGAPYLERYYLCTLLGVRFYLHRFVGSDPDRGLHDHPWPWARSIVLYGYYLEQTREGMREVRWFNKLTGDSFHRVLLLASRPCWTLFFHKAEYTKPWGFLRGPQGQGEQFIPGVVRLWVPHNFPKDGRGTPGAWWREVPQGRFATRRVPL